jgi:hypothetical protein
MSNHDDILSSLNRIEESLSVLVRTQLGPILQSELRDPKMPKIYEMTGENSAT